jgi:hypothetical protein
MNPEERAVHDAFFGEGSMRSSILILCENNTGAQDHITKTISTMLTRPLTLQLTSIGWQPFKGKDTMFPFHMMNEHQRTVFRRLLEDKDAWNTYEHAIVFRKSTQSAMLSHLDVLESLCNIVLESPTYTDKRIRVALCNILLQRIQASIPIDKGTQMKLNERLFKDQDIAAK